MMVRFVNNVKTAFFLALIMVLFAACGQLLGGARGMIIGLLFGGMANIFAYLFSDKIALAATGARPVSESEAPRLYAIVRELAQKAGLPMPRIYICPQAAPNAFATGRNPKHSVVAVTQGLLQLCNEDELRGVLAHEISHIKHRDMLISTIAATMAGAISALAYFAQWALIFGGFGGRDDRRGGNPLALLLMIIVAPIAAALIHMAISRSREYNADSLGGELCGNPRYLANALRKLAEYNKRIPMEVSPTQSHMFIVQPLTGQELANLFSTHPPIEKRIALLEEQAREMGL